MITSMTGFASRIFTVGDETYKMEIKSLNHRFMDLKLRMPRDLNSLESQLKTLIEAQVKRGSIDLWVERQSSVKSDSAFRVNEDQAKLAYGHLLKLKSALQMNDAVTLRDVVNFPDVISKTGTEERGSESFQALQDRFKSELLQLIQDLGTMRKVEGEKLKEALLDIISKFRVSHEKFLGLRSEIQLRAKDKIKKRVEQCFEAYTTTDEKLRALMETRIAQEITYSLEKLDVEEELTRFKGHIEGIENLLLAGGTVGKKLDFMFQELNREINTLGNKSQDLGVSQEVIELKMWIEQMREQSLNLE
jgi:uncharacterized protein (TIGR00255 family)